MSPLLLLLLLLRLLFVQADELSGLVTVAFCVVFDFVVVERLS